MLSVLAAVNNLYGFQREEYIKRKCSINVLIFCKNKLYTDLGSGAKLFHLSTLHLSTPDTR